MHDRWRCTVALAKVWVKRVCVGHEAADGVCVDLVGEEPCMQRQIVEFDGGSAVEGRGGGEYTLTRKGEDESTNTRRSLQEESGRMLAMA